MVIFADYEQIVSSIFFLLDNDDVRKSIEESGVLFMRRLLNNTRTLEKSLRTYLPSLNYSQTSANINSP